MNRIFGFIETSIGKKLIMATTGLLLCGYLIMHVIGNLFLYAGEEAFNQYVEALSSLKPVVRFIEVILALIFLLHIINSLRLTWQNWRAKPTKYNTLKAGEVSPLSSRFMGVTGSVIFIFLVVHLRTFWYTFQVQHGEANYYQIVTGSSAGFGSGIITWLYLVAMFLLGFHLKHGFESAFQTFGIRYNKFGTLIQIIAAVFWLFIPLIFASMPIYFGLLKGGLF